MFLQNRIKISEEDVKNLTQVLAKREQLLALQNSNFLCKDLVTLEENYANQKDSFGKRIGPIVKELGSFVTPTFGTEMKGLYEEYTRNQKAGALQKLQFLCGPSANGLPILPGVSICIRDEGSHKLQFWSGMLCLRSLKTREAITGKIILELACYFDKRRALYSKIQEVLAENAGEFSEATTPEFLEDLVLLFSAKTTLKDIKNFNIDFKAAKERKIYEKFHRNKRVWVERMTCHVRDRNTPGSYFSRLNTEIWLEQKNTLIFNTYENDCTDQSIEIEAYSEVREFIEEKANDMLNQLISITNFQAEIYEEVKTKIFLENL